MIRNEKKYCKKCTPTLAKSGLCDGKKCFYGDADWDGDGIPNSKDKENRVDVPEHPWKYEPKKKFKETWFGRTLRGKTITGKIGGGIIGVATTLVTGLDIAGLIDVIQLLKTTNYTMEDLSLIQFIVVAVFTLLSTVIAYFKGRDKVDPKTAGKLEVYNKFLQDEFVRVTDEDSDKGGKITPGEAAGISKNLLRRIFGNDIAGHDGSP